MKKHALTKVLTIVPVLGMVLSGTAMAQSESNSPDAAYAERTAALAALPILPCDPHGPTSGDASVSTALQGQLTAKMSGGVNPGQVACARMVVQAVKDRGLNRRAATIAIATVIVESSLNDVEGSGDSSSSLGLFQQIQAWGSPEARLNPTTATNMFLDRMLRRRGNDGIEFAAVVHHAVGGQAHPPRGCDDAAAPVAEQVAVGRDGHRGIAGEKIGNDDVGGAGKMRAQHHDHRRRLREFVEHFETDANLHSKCVLRVPVRRWR